MTYPLIADRVSIEPLAASDVNAFTGYRQDPEVARWQSWSTDYSRQDALALVETQSDAPLPQPGEWLQLAVRPIGKSGLLGDVAVHLLADQPSTFEIGVTFDRRHQGHGLAGEAVARVLNFLFVDQQAHRVVAFCDARNTAVANLLRRLGFRHESHQVEADFFKGEWTTLDGYALLAREVVAPQ